MERVNKDILLKEEIIIENFKNYLYEMITIARKDFKKNINNLIISTFITILITYMGLKIIGINRALIKAVLTGLFYFVPVIGSGVVMIAWIMSKVFFGGKILAIQLSILFVILIIARQLMEIYVKGNNFNLRPIISFIVFICSYILSNTKGAIIGMGLVFIINCIFEILEIEKYISIYRDKK